MQDNLISEKKLPLGHDELLNLIESEEVYTILSEENMSGFNDLVKYELICIKDDKVFLTELGKEAQRCGVKNFLANKHIELVVAEIPAKIPFRVRKTYLIFSLIFLFLAFLILILQMIWQPSQ